MVEREIEIDQYIKKRKDIIVLFISNLEICGLFTVSWKINRNLINVQIGLSISQRSFSSC